MNRQYNQISIFDILEINNISDSTNENKIKQSLNQSAPIASKYFSNYSLGKYMEDVEKLGLKNTWDQICQKTKMKSTSDPQMLSVDNFSELYEIGLAIEDKTSKKTSGQYYTPDDVATVMSKWLFSSNGENVCDVACGTGKLILSYLDLIGYDQSRALISSGKLFLYDIDSVALNICKTSIAKKYGFDLERFLHIECCDFLDEKVTLPKNCKVISNPPYAKIKYIPSSWKHTKVLLDTNEYYSVFMEKIYSQAESAVIITPFSFLSGNKFFSLREQMSKLGNGFVVSFDNVPGNIFRGKKKGIFNSNTANSVRAAISFFTKSNIQKGFKISPLIRFKNQERQRLLNNSVLESTLPDNYQIVNKNYTKFEKVDKDLTRLFDAWKSKSDIKMKNILSSETTEYSMNIPTTCRYFTTASKRELIRAGSIQISVKNERDFYFLYCFLNSSFGYWWWRIYDGGITYPVNLLYSLPLPINLLTPADETFFFQMGNKLMGCEKDYLVTKMNAGVLQENIKFPDTYRTEINNKILRILDVDMNVDLLNKIHSNCFWN